jgi:hypothetical protein
VTKRLMALAGMRSGTAKTPGSATSVCLDCFAVDCAPRSSSPHYERTLILAVTVTIWQEKRSVVVDRDKK